MRDLTAKEWIEQHATRGKDGNYTISQYELDEYLTEFILPHKACNQYNKGVCNHEDAPNPGHSRCIGTYLCLTHNP